MKFYVILLLCFILLAIPIYSDITLLPILNKEDFKSCIWNFCTPSSPAFLLTDINITFSNYSYISVYSNFTNSSLYCNDSSYLNGNDSSYFYLASNPNGYINNESAWNVNYSNGYNFTAFNGNSYWRISSFGVSYSRLSDISNYSYFCENAVNLFEPNDYLKSPFYNASTFSGLDSGIFFGGAGSSHIYDTSSNSLHLKASAIINFHVRDFYMQDENNTLAFEWYNPDRIMNIYGNMFLQNNISLGSGGLFIGNGSLLTDINMFNSTYDIYAYNQTIPAITLANTLYINQSLNNSLNVSQANYSNFSNYTTYLMGLASTYYLNISGFNASNITSGTISKDRFGVNVSWINQTNNWTQPQNFTNINNTHYLSANNVPICEKYYNSSALIWCDCKNSTHAWFVNTC